MASRTVMVNVPLYADTVAPAMVTLWPELKPCPKEVAWAVVPARLEGELRLYVNVLVVAEVIVNVPLNTGSLLTPEILMEVSAEYPCEGSVTVAVAPAAVSVCTSFLPNTVCPEEAVPAAADSP